jgi:membrane protease YdiL (CAAX protease family)
MSDSSEGRSAGNKKKLHWFPLIALHLFPGLLITAAYYSLANSLTQRNIPAYVALMLTILLCLIPVLLGIMWLSRHQSRFKHLLAPEKSYRYSGTLLEHTLLPFALCLLFMALAWITSPLTSLLKTHLASWVPAHAGNESLLEGMRSCPLYMRRIAIWMGILFSGIAAPVVEEIYFRGFLLPRMDYLGIKAPLINALLFAIYHFFAPWNVPVIFLGFIPIAYTVWVRKNVRIGIIAHVLINLWGVVQVVTATRGG